MEYENTKAKGSTAELEALAFFSRAGYTVSLPFGDNAPYDLLIESPSKKLYRIQVRWASWKKGALLVSLRRSASGKNIPLDRTRIEAFLVWDGVDPYIIPTRDLKGVTAAVTLRRDPPKNGQRKGIRLAAPFRGHSIFYPSEVSVRQSERFPEGHQVPPGTKVVKKVLSAKGDADQGVLGIPRT